MSTPVITIFVRHSADCKYNGDEFEKRCNCRKHLRWSLNGKQYRKKAGTRSWAQAETEKRRLEDQLAGRVSTEPEGQVLMEAIQTYKQDKKAQGVKRHTLMMYEYDLSRLESFCEGRACFTVVAALTLENLIAFRDTWPTFYKSSYSRAVAQKRISNFLQFCYNASWLPRIPKLSPIKIDSPETEPLTDAEYTSILENVPKVFEGDKAKKISAIIKLMRWSGLAVRDASTLKRSHVLFDKETGVHKIVSSRVKTKTALYIPIPADVTAEVLAVANGNPDYIFWERRDGSETRQAAHASEDIAKVFAAAGVKSDGHMISHRLRATFAVDLLQKGVPLEHVSKLLGHKSVTTTERHYARWVKGRQVLLENIVSSTWRKS